MNLSIFSPEIVLMAGSLIVFIICLGDGRSRLAAGATIVTALAMLAACLASMGSSGELFFKAYKIDFFSQLFKCFIGLGFAAVAIFGRRLKDIREDVRPEFFFCLLLGVMGLTMLVSSVELISLFIALELSSYALYLLVPLRRERAGLRIQMESAAKYVMFGIAAAGILLFGISYIYGLTGSTYFSEIAPALKAKWNEPAMVVGMILVLTGLFFKLAAFPMHLWAPDVYQGASNETTAFIAAVPKVAIVAVIIRFLMCMDAASQPVIVFISLASVCSMFFGNLAALVQKDIKRMLGYSSIAHAGYILLGLVTLQGTGYAAAAFYIFSFLAMSLTAFVVICALSADGENVMMDDLSGLHKRSPLAAFLLASSMFALAGIPPFAGFIGKFLLLNEAVKAGYLMLAVVAAVNTAIGIYYYLSVVRVVYFTDPGAKGKIIFDRGVALTGVVLVILVVLLGIVPGRLVEAAIRAMSNM